VDCSSGGTAAALLVNDVVVFAMTPLLCAGPAAKKLDARPFLLGLAAASNAGSAATLIGNPQNILIGQVGRLGFWSYSAIALVPSVSSLLITFACIGLVWRSSLTTQFGRAPAAAPPLDRRQAAICGIALVVVTRSIQLPREMSALLVAACLIVSRTVTSRQLLDEIDLPLLISCSS
jgi:Na+/H+ antiporter NhaD/arsenite permease-like protein